MIYSITNNDRFIRQNTEENRDFFNLEFKPNENTSRYTDILCKQMFSLSLEEMISRKVLSDTSASRKNQNIFSLHEEQNFFNKKVMPFVDTSVHKVLDFPGPNIRLKNKYADFSKNGTLGVANGETVYILGSVNSKIQTTVDSNAPVRSIVWLDNNVLCAGTEKGTLEILDVNASKISHIFQLKSKPTITFLESIDQNQVVASTENNQLISFDTRENGVHILAHGQSELYTAKLSPHSPNLLACGTDDGEIKIFDVRKSQQDTTEMLCFKDVHTSAIKALTWHPIFHDRLITGSCAKDDAIKQTDIVSKSIIPMNHTKGKVVSINVLKKNTHNILSTINGEEKIVQLWSFRPKTTVLYKEAIYQQHSDNIVALEVSKDEKKFVTISKDESLAIWKLPTSKKTTSKGGNTSTFSKLSNSLLR